MLGSCFTEAEDGDGVHVVAFTIAAAAEDAAITAAEWFKPSAFCAVAKILPEGMLDAAELYPAVYTLGLVTQSCRAF